MTKIVPLNINYNGTVIQTRDDGFVNLTQMAAAGGKRLDNFWRLKETQKYVDVLKANSLTSEVVDVIQGSGGGTWGHPSLAINLARWVSADFALWCDAHIFNLMTTGSTSIDEDPLEKMRLQIELKKAEALVHHSEQNLLDRRQALLTFCNEEDKQIIFGYNEVKTIEYRDRLIDTSTGDLLNDGSTISKTAIAKRWGFKSAQTKAFRTIWDALDIPEEWTKTQSYEVKTLEIKREFLPQLEEQKHRKFPRDHYLGE